MNTLTTLPRALMRRSPTTTSITISTPLIFTRGEATSRRLTKKLRLPPHPSMVVGGHGGAPVTASSPATTHIIHNPPSAAPSTYSTPSLFLPVDDPRRDPFSAFDGDGREPKLPPPVSGRPYREKTYHLSQAQIDEIRGLRAENPDRWTRRKLAERFGTSEFFVGMVAEASQQRKDEMQGRLATIKSRWGTIRTTARFEKMRRRSGWGGADGQ